MELRLTVLGSGTIVPSPERRATSLLIEGGGEAVLIDCGPGSLQALEECGRSYRELRTIFFTHFHPDHTLGLGRLFSAMANDRAPAGKRRLSLYGPEGIEKFVAGWDALYSGIVPYGEALDLAAMEPGDAMEIGDMLVTAGPAEHGRKPVLSYRIGRGGRSLVYTGDTGPSGGLANFAKGADLLVAECSFPDQSPVEGHLTPSMVGRLASSAGVGRVLLVHMYPLFGETDPAEEVGRHFGGVVTTGSDGLVIEV